MTNAEWSYNATQAKFYKDLEGFLEKQQELYDAGDSTYDDIDLIANIIHWWNRYTSLTSTEFGVLIALCDA